ncbi:MAG: hypothetical protein M3Y67_07000 [Pseudomonadota bacterium]|nr:hypothetical protein [Pseudomonadota bacterium]
MSADFAESMKELSGEPRVTNTEVEHLRARIVALESVTVAMLATASEGQLALVREMAKYIAPRPGSTQHPLTRDACFQIISLVERAEQLRD